MTCPARPTWDQRIARAEERALVQPYAAEILKFYGEITCFQKNVYLSFKPAVQQEAGLRDTLHPAPLLPDFPVFLALVERAGPLPLAQAAQEVSRAGQTRWEDLLSRFWQSAGTTATMVADCEIFFARAFLQPLAEYLAENTPASLPRFGGPICPLCARKPQAGILREEGHGAKRSLLCSFCSTEWDFRRIVCPACGEDRFDHLPVYSAGEFEHVRVDACDSCKTYIKTIDLTKNGLAVPVVDELATTPLDLWATEKGYTKLELNLLRM